MSTLSSLSRCGLFNNYSLKFRCIQTKRMFVRPPLPGWDSHMKGTGMLVVSLRGVNFRFWSRLGCSGQNTIIFSRKGLF